MEFWLENTMGKCIKVDGVDTTSSKIRIGMRNSKGEIIRGINWMPDVDECQKGSWGFDDEFTKKNILREGTIIVENLTFSGKMKYYLTFSGKMKYYPRLEYTHLEEGTEEYKDEENHFKWAGKYAYSPKMNDIVVLFTRFFLHFFLLAFFNCLMLDIARIVRVLSWES